MAATINTIGYNYDHWSVANKVHKLIFSQQSINNVHYLTRTIFVARAVILIDDNGVLDILHYNMLENNIPGKTIAGSGPRLYPHPILGTNECGCFYCHILHSSLILVLPQTPNAAQYQNMNIQNFLVVLIKSYDLSIRLHITTILK